MPEAISTEPLAQLLKSIALHKRTGIVRVEQLGEKNPQQGKIYFENGRPQQAQAGQETGKAALQRINEWKQVTCAFYNVTRPFPLAATVSAPVSQPKIEQKPLTRLQTTAVPVTDKLARAPETIVAEALTGVKAQPTSWREGTKKLPTTQQSEVGMVEQIRTVASPVQSNQQLILHGATLEAYTPEQPARPSRSVQRWTTHLGPQTAAMPSSPPITPRLGPLPGEEVLPGRTAIFKARATATTPQVMQSMERRERIIFILLDGRRTIQDIALLIHQPESDVEEMLVQLTKNGYIQYIQG